MNEPIHELIDEYVEEFGLTEADMELPSYGPHINISRRDVARLIFHAKRQDVYVDAFLAGDAA